jgi:ABC-type ATPase involved in cell division
MAAIKIKNFGPIRTGFTQKEGFLEISKVTLFIGNQGSGKSTVAKLISTFTWMEKALVRGDYTEDSFSGAEFQDERLGYHRLGNYLSNNTEIEYHGQAYSFVYKGKNLYVTKIQNTDYSLPQIIYIPAERNIIAAASNAGKLKNISGSLIDFLGEYTNALNNMHDRVCLPINDTSIEYDRTKSMVYISGNNYRIPFSDSSSGFQSLAPLYLVSQYLCNLVRDGKNSEPMNVEEKKRFSEWNAKVHADPALNDEQKRLAITEYAKRFNKTSFINIIEEPEQNLFPAAQNFLLQKLLAFNNVDKENNTGKTNKLIMTTHSPYLINYLTLAVEAGKIEKHCKTPEQKDRLSKIVPVESRINAEDLAIYELNERDGTISLLESYEGLPSDENQLNKSLRDANNLFSNLIDLEQELCL